MSTINQAAVGNVAGNYGMLGGLGIYLSNSLGNYLQTGMSSGSWGKGNFISAFGDKGASYNSKIAGGGSLTGFDSGIGAVAGFAGGLLDKSAAHQRTSGKYGHVAQTVDTVGNIAGAVGNFNPIASGAGRLAMGAVNKITGGTDGMTVQDSLLGSGAVQGALTGLAAATGPIGWGVAGAYLLASGINAATGKTTTDNAYKSFMDKDKLSEVSDAYTDMNLENEAESLYNKKYGGFSRGAYKKAQKKIDEAQMRMTNKIDIRDTAKLGQIRAGMVDANRLKYQMAINGGYKPLAIGKEGLKITPERMAEAKRIAKCIKKKKSPIFNVIPAEAREAMQDVTKVPNDALPFFLKGGRPKLNSEETGEDPIGYLNDGTPLYKKGDGTIGSLTKENIGKDNLFDLIKNSNANWAKRLQDPNRKYITYPDGSVGNFKLAWSEDETGTIVYPEILEINGLLIDLSEDREKAWRSAIEHNDYIYFPSNDAAEWFTKNYKNYYKGFNKSALKFQEGGLMNVIPEGALHARKHNMENAEHITKKGIPVVDLEGKQQAEIERNEIIFRKEVTDKLEKLAKDGSDEAAIEAGKLLAQEIIENTEDRTGLIQQVTEDSLEKIPKAAGGFDFSKISQYASIASAATNALGMFKSAKQAKSSENDLASVELEIEGLKNRKGEKFIAANIKAMSENPVKVDENGNVVASYNPEEALKYISEEENYQKQRILLDLETRRKQLAKGIETSNLAAQGYQTGLLNDISGIADMFSKKSPTGNDPNKVSTANAASITKVATSPNIPDKIKLLKDGDKLPDVHLGLLEELKNLSPDKLKELLAILKYLKQ